MRKPLIFFIVETRPDITFGIFIISQYTKNLNHYYIKIIKTILKLLKDFKN